MYVDKRESINSKSRVQDFYLKEVNEVIDYTETHFYINIAHNPIQYGVRVNIKDKDKMQEIINQFKTERREQIEAWNEEQHQRNIKALAK